MSELALVADIGGTNARFALASMSAQGIAIDAAQSFRAEDYETIRDAADAYLESVAEKPSRACFAVASPVGAAEIKFTNSPWRFRPHEIEKALSLREFRVINDFYALAAGVSHLSDSAFVSVKDGAADPEAPKLVIGPGTGLGQALIVPTKEGEKVIATEGGHVTFAPRTDEEFQIMKFIAREHPRVSVERLLSGRGLVNIHRALCAAENTQRVSLQANEITAAAINKTYPIAVKAVNMFCELIGRVAGDAVLATGARGGVILGGGILPKIKDVFLTSAFSERFVDKGRMRDYVEATPVKLIVQDGSALFGAAASLSDGV
ncbi:MAG: glucokinase [Pseudomonadota bacterium]